MNAPHTDQVIAKQTDDDIVLILTRREHDYRLHFESCFDEEFTNNEACVGTLGECLVRMVGFWIDEWEGSDSTTETAGEIIQRKVRNLPV